MLCSDVTPWVARIRYDDVRLELLQLINILCTLSMCFRMLKVLSFQPKLGIVTQTLFIAASDLLHFSFLFFAKEFADCP